MQAKPYFFHKKKHQSGNNNSPNFINAHKSSSSDVPIPNTCNVYSFTSPKWIMKVLEYMIHKVTEISLFAINGRKTTRQIHWPGISSS